MTVPGAPAVRRRSAFAAALRSTLAAAAGCAVLVGAGCGPPRADFPVRLRHEPRRTLTYLVEEKETADDPILGLGGTIESTARVRLACVGTLPAGNGAEPPSAEIEVTVDLLRLRAPTPSGIAVDTTLGRPVPGDKTGANAVVLSLLPRRAMFVVDARGVPRVARPDAEVMAQLTQWSANRAKSAQGPVQRIAERVDPLGAVGLVYGSLDVLLPATAEPLSEGTWTVDPPPVETPAGPLRTTLTVTLSRLGPDATLVATGTFREDPGATDRTAPAAGRAARLVSGGVTFRARIDALRGHLTDLVEDSRIVLLGQHAGAKESEWTRKRIVKREP